MVSYLHSFNLCIKIKEMENTSATIIYNSIECRHSWRIPYIRIKGSDKKPFILT